MNIKKYHFNNKYLQRNDNLYNSQTISKNPQKNTRYYDKNFYHSSLPNQSLNLNQNIFLPSEQSTLLTSEDIQNKNVNIVEKIKRRNNCHCLCHQIEETMKHSYNNIHIINCFHHINNNSYYRPVHNSVEIGQNRNLRKTKNFELLYNYEKIKKQYNIIWPGCNHSRNERWINNNYSTVNKDNNKNKFSYSNNNNILENNPNLRHLNRSCDDLNDNDNYDHNFLLRKTKAILGFIPLGYFSSKNKYFHYKPKSVSYRTYDDKTSSTKDNKDNKYQKKNIIDANNKKKEIPNFANFTFKEKIGDNDNNKDNMRYNQLINDKNNPINYNINDDNNKKKDDLINNKINTEIQNSNKKENNNLIKDSYNSENPKIDDDKNGNKINNNDDNNIIKSNSKQDDINYNNDLQENNNNNISSENDNYNRNKNQDYNDKLSKTFEENNTNFRPKKDNKNIKDNNLHNNNNIDINKDIKDILKERNLFLKIKKKKKEKDEEGNNLNNEINDNTDPNEKIIREILNFKLNNETNNKNKKKKNNQKCLDRQNNTIDDIIEKILRKNYGKKTEPIYKKKTNNKKNNFPNSYKIKYSNVKNDKNQSKFGISNKMNAKDYKSFKDLKKEKQPSIKDNKNKNKVNKNNTKNTAKTPNKNIDDMNKNNLNLNKNKIPKYQTKNIQNNLQIKEPFNINKSNNLDKKGKYNQRSLSTNNIEKKPKNKINNIKKIKKKDTKNNQYNKNLPYLDIFHLNKINKLIHDSRYKNSILYNRIIQPYNNTKTLINNNISYKQPKIKCQYENKIDDINNKENINNLIKGKKEIFNLALPERNNRLKNSKSCILDNRYNLGKINYLSRNQSANFGNCFACFFGCSVSLSGYSPMNFSPYDGRKREDNLAIPSEILYQNCQKY